MFGYLNLPLRECKGEFSTYRHANSEHAYLQIFKILLFTAKLFRMSFHFFFFYNSMLRILIFTRLKACAVITRL